MMVNVANEGTASGLSTTLGQLAGKTGTAEIDVEASINRPWFIGFAPAEDPQIAVAAMIEQLHRLLRRRGRGADRDAGHGRAGGE